MAKGSSLNREEVIKEDVLDMRKKEPWKEKKHG